METAVILVGHGTPATDCPPELVGELMSLEWRASGDGTGTARIKQRTEELDAKIRNWPRHARNDPYKAGLERLADTLRPLLPDTPVLIAYNEFCRPAIAEAIAQAVAQGAARVLAIPTMVTPGGVHSERDIPGALADARRAHPGVAIDYVWPFDLRCVAELFAAHVRRA